MLPQTQASPGIFPKASPHLSATPRSMSSVLLTPAQHTPPVLPEALFVAVRFDFFRFPKQAPPSLSRLRQPKSADYLSSPSSLCLANSCTSCRARLSGHLLQEGCPTWTQSLHVPPQHRNPGLPPPLPRPVSGHTLPRSQDPTLLGTPGTLTPQTHELSQKQPALDCGAWAPSLVSLVLSA